MMRNPRWKIAVFLLSLLALSSPGAQKKPAPGPAFTSDASASLTSGITWKNASLTGTDWVASGTTPRFNAAGKNDFRLILPGAPWLVLGGKTRAGARVALDSRSPAGKAPYLVAERADLSALAGLVAGVEPSLGAVTVLLDVSLEGGLRVLDLNEADPSYTPLTAEADAFWFRILPGAASTQRFRIDAGKIFNFGVENRAEMWWDAEYAYGRNFAPGFSDEADIEIAYLIGSSGPFSWNGGLEAHGELDSGLIIPEVAAYGAITTAFKIDKVLRLKLGMITCNWKATMPGMDYNLISPTDLMFGSSVALKSYLDKGAWTLELGWPWKALEGPAEWKLSFGMEYTN